jgi:hypothetical protein
MKFLLPRWRKIAVRSPEDAYRLVALLDGVYRGNYLNGSP